ncbi:hypothetical protein ABIB85_004361 [Bradyrhizobium sp. JR1.5]
MVATDECHPSLFSLLATAASRPGSHTLSATLKMPFRLEERLNRFWTSRAIAERWRIRMPAVTAVIDPLRTLSILPLSEPEAKAHETMAGFLPE